MNIQTDIVIIGSGIAALQAAHQLSSQYNVHIISKGTFQHSSTYKAQGGVAAVLSPLDHLDLHKQDTLIAGEYHHFEPNVDLLIEQGAQAMQRLLSDGFQADRLANGDLSLGLEGAHSRHRIVHAGGDATGKNLVMHLLHTLPSNVTMHFEEFAYELIKNENGECCGVKTKNKKGSQIYNASYVILATGGASALYATTSNWTDNTGDGIALAYLAGAEVTDMEFVQFHPSLLFVDGQARGLVSEAVRGAGGIFVDEQGVPIMEGKHPLGDLAPRHITAYEMYKMRATGQNVYIDITAIEHFEQKFPTITKLCVENGVSLQEGRIPIAPGSHFLMGGVVAKANGQTSIPRLYAIGEVACTGVHGANRLASNSLLEGMAFGELMAKHLLAEGTLLKQTNRQSMQPRCSLPTFSFSRETLRHLLLEHAGIVRTEASLSKLASSLSYSNTRYYLDSATRDEIELYFMHLVASFIVHAALTRTESRGAHIRTDYIEKKETWQNRWIVFQQGTMNVRNNLYECHQTKIYANAIL